MQITRQADYAIRAVRYISKQGTEENIAKRIAARKKPITKSAIAKKKDISPSSLKEEKEPKVPTSEVADVMNIPASFLAKIISQLTIKGILVTSRGAHGGVSLAREPQDISLLDVVEAIDGPILLNECVGSNKPCRFEDDCLVHPIWLETQKNLVSRLRETRFDVLYK
jgi:Rrf2 family protein